MKTHKPLTEADVRQLRDNIYGECSDKNWAACREFIDEKTSYHGGWMRPENIAWLQANQPNGKP